MLTCNFISLIPVNEREYHKETDCTVSHLIYIFSLGLTSWASSSTRERIKPRHQETSLTLPSPLQPPAHPQNGCPVSLDTHRPQEWEQPRQVWHGSPKLCRSRGGHWGFAARPTQVREGGTTTPIMPSWWEWVACWEPAKCRTSATDSISSSVRAAEKTRPPLTLEALIVSDELDTSKHPQQVYLYLHLFIS